MARADRQRRGLPAPVATAPGGGPLTRAEILASLRKMGFRSPEELKRYCRQYECYAGTPQLSEADPLASAAPPLRR